MNFPDKAPKFSLNGITTQAKVIKVYDGDTITVIFKYNNKFWTWRCRLLGINAPELRKASPFSYECRDILREKILNKEVKLVIEDFDCFGRLLTTVYYNGENVNDFMLTEGYAKKF